MENISLWCGIGSGIASVIAIIVLFLTRQNIKDILDKDAILFDENFAIKKEAISSASNLIDHISTKGKQITANPDFAQRAKQSYNDLLCVLSNVKIADEFYDIAIDQFSYVDDVRIENFKRMCRKDIGLRTTFKKANKKPVQPQMIQPTAQPVQNPTPVHQSRPTRTQK